MRGGGRRMTNLEYHRRRETESFRPPPPGTPGGPSRAQSRNEIAEDFAPQMGSTLMAGASISAARDAQWQRFLYKSFRCLKADGGGV